MAQQSSGAPLSRWASALSEYVGLDLGRTSPFRLPGGREPDCCTEHHPACLPLRVADRCVNFVRVLPAPQLDCVMRAATPLSTASSYLDLDPLYGVSEEAGRRLRTFHGGRLRADRGLDGEEVNQELFLGDDIFAGASSEVHLRRRRSELGQASLSPPPGRELHRYVLIDPGTRSTFESINPDTAEATDRDLGLLPAEATDRDFELFPDLFDSKEATERDGKPCPPGRPGMKGAKGDKGMKGMTGGNGKPGEPGFPGLKGEPGNNGRNGARGNPGRPGTPGRPGRPGSPGAKGDKGDVGMKGETGAEGPMGEKGMQGENGEKGDKGDVGPEGPPGAAGEKGEEGRPGSPGFDGQMGVKGMKGENGMKGDPGKDGEKGDQGERGPRGYKGDTGRKGDVGPQGPPGVTKIIYVNKPSSEYGAPQPDYPTPSPGYQAPRVPHPAPSSHYGAPPSSWNKPYGSPSLFRLRRLPTLDRPTLRPSVEVSPGNLHQLLLSEHNRVADVVRRNHPHWEDERVFQLARRVVIAEWQHIVYREYLPHVLGTGVARRLASATGPDVDPSVNVEFTAAAFRFWQRPSMTKRVHMPSKSSRRSFLDLVRGTVASPGTTRSLMNTASGVTDSGSSKLAAVDVLRGRELGLPTYATIRELCTGQNVTSWDDLDEVVPQPELDALRLTYASPRDIDLWVGGMVEGLAPTAKLGPTFQCIIEDQFRRLRDGDRHFYDRSLSGPQLEAVQRSSLARLLCDNQPGGRDGVLPLVLEPISAQNQMTLCTAAAIPRVNLDLF